MATNALTLQRKLPKQQRARETIDAILQATARILVNEGVDAATTNHIADRAGVGVGSLYQYFPNKEAIVFALVQRHIEEMRHQLEEMAQAFADAPLEEGIPAYVRAMFAAHRVDPKLHRVFSEQLPKLAGRDYFQQIFNQIEAIVRAYLQRHTHRLRPPDLELATFLLIHAVDAATHAVVLMRPRYLDQETLAEEVSQLVLRYLLKDGAA